MKSLILFSIIFTIGSRDTLSFAQSLSDHTPNIHTAEGKSNQSSKFQPSTQNFIITPFTHTGKGASTMTAYLPVGSKNPSFTISNLDAQLTGNSTSQFNEQVTITYEDQEGIVHHFGTFSEDKVSMVNVKILDHVRSITISLRDKNDIVYNETLSITNSTINYHQRIPQP